MPSCAAKRSLHRKVTALIAAYAIALSGLIASFGAANAVGVAAVSGGIICHTPVDGRNVPAPAEHGKLCVDGCCGLGCAMTMAALPPPPATAAPIAQRPSHRLALPVLAVRTDGTNFRSNRSRAPPA